MPLSACPESAHAMKRSVDAAPTAGGVVKLLTALKPVAGSPNLHVPCSAFSAFDLHHVAMRNPKASAMLCTHASCIYASAKRLHYTGATQAGTAGTESTAVFQYGLRSLCSCGQS